jgi:hypothetical protein
MMFNARFTNLISLDSFRILRKVPDLPIGLLRHNLIDVWYLVLLVLRHRVSIEPRGDTVKVDLFSTGGHHLRYIGRIEVCSGAAGLEDRD